MNNTLLLYRRNSDLIAADMDGDIVMLSIERGEYYGVGGVGSRVWELLANPVSLPEIVTTICEEYEIDETRCHSDIARFLNQLEASGLIDVDQG